MNEISDLSRLKEGQCAIVRSINLSGDMRRRLQDLGLICGTRVKCLYKNPKGNTGAFCVRGASIALRDCDSQFIGIEICCGRE